MQAIIGDEVTFRDLAGCSHRGRVVGLEQVGRGDINGRSAGPWATIRLAGSLFEDVSVPTERIGAILDDGR